MKTKPAVFCGRGTDCFGLHAANHGFRQRRVSRPKDGVLFTTISEIKGLKNQAAFINKITPPDSRFMVETNMPADDDN
jgi:hypothetical protein